ncbi:MAG TPA: PDZ domain-containing protein [Bacteroidetes bacterium]|nr:PDZ domain-containing protein [Bacteroidota bacterium]
MRKYLLRTGAILILVSLTAAGCSARDKTDSLKAASSSVDSSRIFQKTAAGQANEPKGTAAIRDVRQNAITRAVQKVAPAVVGVNVTQIREYVANPFANDPFFRFFFPGTRYRQKVKSLGSGFIISPDGYIVTNEHVIHNATQIMVTMVAGKNFPAKLIGSDYTTDIALLKIGEKDLPYCQLGNSDDIIVGEWAIALGNPFGLFELSGHPSVTVGVVSATGLNFGRQGSDRVYQNMLQTDASINPGNSGGPMADATGKVIGVNTFIFTGGNYSQGSIGLGFAIPINRVKRVIADIKRFGKVNRQFWTGLEVDNINYLIARYFGLSSTNGVIVTNVQKNSPAKRAGILVGDIILAINGQKIRKTQDIWTIFTNMDAKAGDVLKLTIYRKGRKIEIPLKLAPIRR